MSKIYYVKDVPKEERENLFNCFKPEDYVKQYNISLDVAKNIICRTFLEGGGLEELELYMIDAGERNKKTVLNHKHKIKTAKPKLYTIDNADLNVICHSTVTYLLSREAGKEYEGKEQISIDGENIKWFDVLVLSAIHQAYRETFGNAKGYVLMKRIYEIMYGRKIDLHNTKAYNEFCKKVLESVQKWTSFEGDYQDPEGNNHLIDDKFYLDYIVDGKDCILVKRCKLMDLVEARHSLNVINHGFLDEKRCLMQEVKSYIVYRLNQHTGHNQGRIKRSTLDKVMAKHISDYLLEAVLASMPDELDCKFNNDGIMIDAQVVKHLTTLAAD